MTTAAVRKKTTKEENNIAQPFITLSFDATVDFASLRRTLYYIFRLFIILLEFLAYFSSGVVELLQWQKNGNHQACVGFTHKIKSNV